MKVWTTVTILLLAFGCVIQAKAQRPLSREELLKEQQWDLELIWAAEGVLSAPTLEISSDIYCRYTIDQIWKLAGPAISDAQRRERWVATLERTNQCKANILTGYQRMPSPSWFREKIDKARRDLIEIDKKLSPAKQPEPTTMPLDPLWMAKLPEPVFSGTLPERLPAPPEPGYTYPVLLRRIEPGYSDTARNAKWQGYIHASVVIDDQGNVTSVKVLDAPPGLDLERSVIRAVSQWKFKPASKDGRSIPWRAEVETMFRLL